MFGKRKSREQKQDETITDEMRTVTFKEFWALCLAAYKEVLPKTLILAASLIVAAMLLKWFFSK